MILIYSLEARPPFLHFDYGDYNYVKGIIPGTVYKLDGLASIVSRKKSENGSGHEPLLP